MSEQTRPISFVEQLAQIISAISSVPDQDEKSALLTEIVLSGIISPENVGTIVSIVERGQIDTNQLPVLSQVLYSDNEVFRKLFIQGCADNDMFNQYNVGIFQQLALSFRDPAIFQELLDPKNIHTRDFLSDETRLQTFAAKMQQEKSPASVAIVREISQLMTDQTMMRQA